MAELDRLSITDGTTLMTGVGLEALVTLGAIETLNSDQPVIQKIVELGVVGVIGVLGLGAIGYGIDRIRDARYYRANQQTALQAPQVQIS